MRILHRCSKMTFPNADGVVACYSGGLIGHRWSWLCLWAALCRWQEYSDCLEWMWCQQGCTLWGRSMFFFWLRTDGGVFPNTVVVSTSGVSSQVVDIHTPRVASVDSLASFLRFSLILHWVLIAKRFCSNFCTTPWTWKVVHGQPSFVNKRGAGEHLRLHSPVSPAPFKCGNYGASILKHTCKMSCQDLLSSSDMSTRASITQR